MWGEDDITQFFQDAAVNDDPDSANYGRVLGWVDFSISVKAGASGDVKTIAVPDAPTPVRVTVTRKAFYLGADSAVWPKTTPSSPLRAPGGRAPADFIKWYKGRAGAPPMWE